MITRPKSSPDAIAQDGRKPSKTSSRAKKTPDLARRARDARSIRSKAALLEAATELFATKGYAGFSVNAIVRSAGIAKTTIYRHWPNQNQLLIAVLTEMARKTGLPDTGGLRQDLIEHLTTQIHSAQARDSKGVLRNLPSLLQAAQQDHGVVDVVNFCIDGYLQNLRIILERAKLRGELRADRDLETMISVIFGTMSVQGTLNRDQGDEAIARLIDTVIDGIGAR